MVGKGLAGQGGQSTGRHVSSQIHDCILRSFASATAIKVRSRYEQHGPCTRILRGYARRCLSRRSSCICSLCSYTRRGPSRRSSRICFFGGRAHRWPSRRSSCMSFLCGRNRRWRRRRSSCVGFFGGCEGTSCGPGAFPTRLSLSLVEVISQRSQALLLH